MNETIKYNDGEIEVSISINEDTIWLTQKQIAELFDVTKQNISLHVIEIFKSQELKKSSTVKKYLIVQKEGNREVSRELEHYNLDVIISIGYRVNSIKATKFRQWSTNVLKEYIHTQGYVINTHKITEHRLTNLENDMQFVKSKVKNDELQVKQNNVKRVVFSSSAAVYGDEPTQPKSETSQLKPIHLMGMKSLWVSSI